MAFALSEELQRKFAAMREVEAGYAGLFGNLSDSDLVSSARFWLQHCDQPKRFTPGTPVYDATFWFVVVPEMLKRLEGKAAEPPSVSTKLRRELAQANATIDVLQGELRENGEGRTFYSWAGRITPQQRRIMGALIQAGPNKLVRHRDLFEVMADDHAHDNRPDADGVLKNLHVQIRNIRKELGRDCLVNMFGEGYSIGRDFYMEHGPKGSQPDIEVMPTGGKSDG